MRYFESKAEKVGVSSPGPVQAVVAHDPDSLWAIPHVSTVLTSARHTAYLSK